MGKVLYGIRNVHIAKLIEDENGNITYGTPFAVKGARGFSPDPQGDTTIYYADDMIYFRKDKNNGYEGDLVLAVTPEQFLTEILGRTKDTNGLVIESSEDKFERFALLFEGEGDPTNRRYVYWDCTASRPTREHNTTEDSTEPGEDTLTITIAPRSSDRAVGGYVEPTEENIAYYNAFFDAVVEKNQASV